MINQEDVCLRENLPLDQVFIVLFIFVEISCFNLLLWKMVEKHEMCFILVIVSKFKEVTIKKRGRQKKLKKNWLSQY